MRIEIYEHKGAEDNYRLECRIYEISDDVKRILVDDRRALGNVWGFDAQGNQHEAELVSFDKDVIILA